MPTATLETPEQLKPVLDAAEAEVQQLEEKASKAKSAELGTLASALATARTLLDLLLGRYKAAVAAQQAAQAVLEAAQREQAHINAAAALVARKATAEADWVKWGTEAEAVEARAFDLWIEYDRLQGEMHGIPIAERELGASVGAISIAPTASEFVNRCHGPVGALRYLWDYRHGPMIRRG